MTNHFSPLAQDRWFGVSFLCSILDYVFYFGWCDLDVEDVARGVVELEGGGAFVGIEYDVVVV